MLALTKRNSNVMAILLFLHRLVDVFTEYFRELEEESLRDNFVIVYELLDEMMDFGHPQTTEKNILKEFELTIYRMIHVVGILLNKAFDWKRDLQGHLLRLPMQFHGDLKVLNIERMKYSWMWSNLSTCWLILLEM